MRITRDKRLNDPKVVLANYRKYKEAKTGKSYVTTEEKKAILKECLKADKRGEQLKEAIATSDDNKPSYVRENKTLNNFDVVLTNFKKHKQAKLGESKVTYKEIKMLREAVDKANHRGIRLPEADENFQAPAPQDPNMAAADPNAAAGGTAVSPDVQSQIQSLLSQVQALAQAAGVQSADLTGDPNANVPAVDGMGADPNAAAPATADAAQAPMMEAVSKARKANNGKCDEDEFLKIRAKYGKALVEKVGQTRDRIALRAAKLETLNEKYEGDFASAYFENVGLKEATSPIDGIPSEKELAKGTADAKGGLAKELKTPVAWPDHQITGAPLQGDGAKQQKVKESTSSVTDAYVENFYAPKLSLDNIRESMKSGLLG